MSTEAIEFLREDPALAPLIAEYGPISVTPAEDPFKRLVVSIVRQQVSMESAAAINKRLFDRYEINPGSLTDRDPTTLTDVGLSEQKASYIVGAATAFEERGYDHEYFAGMDDTEVREELISIRGIGPWTAKMFLIFVLAREDVFPIEDLGIRNGMESVCDAEMTRGEMKQRAAEWRPFRTYASKYLWKQQDGG